MEQFLGLSTDASKEKAESGTSPFNRNIVYNKKLGSISQENGFKFSHYIEGIIIGVYSTNKHIVYISVRLNKTIISYVEIATEQVIKVIESNYIKYSVERPIEIVAWYNYKGELIIVFSDNVFAKSTAPRLINLTNVGIPLTDYEFQSQEKADLTLLFTNINQPIYKIKYGEASTHGCDLVFFTIAYILPDGVTRTRFIPVLAEAFPVYNFSIENKREITFRIENLSPLFSQFIIGIVAYKDGGLFGYETPIINNTLSTYEYVFSSTENLILSTPEQILVETATFDKVKSLTIGNDTVILGGLYKKPTNLYQKYANNLQLNLYFDNRLDNRHQAPLLCPDEVYYFTIALKRPDGTYTDELHIPNRDSVPSDLTIINKTTMGLNKLKEENIPSFRIINTGKWADPSEGLPNFTSLVETKLEFGYWQNTELYPDDEAYNGTVDYDGVTPIVGGRDLRNTPVKLHRIPGLDELSKKFPMRLGMDIRNQDPLVNDKDTRLPAFSMDIENFLTAFAKPIADKEIDGYRLSFVKKDGSSKIVADNTFIKPLVTVEEFTFRKSNIFPDSNPTKPVKYTQFGLSRVRSINMSVNKGASSARIAKANFGYFESYLTSDDKTNKLNNIYELSYRDMLDDSKTRGTVGQYSEPVNDNTGAGVVDILDNFSFKIPDINYQYATINSIEQIPGNIRSKKTSFIHEQTIMKAVNTNTVYPPSESSNTIDYGWNIIKYTPTGLNDDSTSCPLSFYHPTTSSYSIENVSASKVQRLTTNVTLLNIRKDVHAGLNPTEFVTIGASNLSNPKLLFKDFGDVFTNNIYSEIFEQLDDDITYFQQIFSGMLSIHNNTLVSFKKDKVIGKKYLPIGDADILNTFDYQKIVYTKETTRQLNTLIANNSFNYRAPFVSNYPFRVTKSLNLPSESLSTLNIRSFLSNSYYDLSNLRGIIISVTGFDKGVYIQQRYSLCIIQIKEKLNTNDEDSAYLATSDLFAYKPHIIVDEDNKGYIGSVHQFSRKLTKEGYLAIDAERGRIYLVGQNPTEISKIKMENKFNKLLTPLCNNIVPTEFDSLAVEDNPYNGVGVVTAFDDVANRILVTILNFKKLSELPVGNSYINGIPYNGNTAMDIKNPTYSINKAKTFSFNIDWKRWVAEHDYTPQFYFNTNKFNYGGINVYSNTVGSIIENRVKGHIYILNKVNQKSGLYLYITDPTVYQSYTDLLFNSRYDLSKWYKSVNWRTTVIDTNGNNNYFKTVDAIMFYTDYQCSGIIALDTERFGLVRNGEGLWTFNDFRDMVVDSDALPIDENGRVDAVKLHNNRIWFEKSDFISNFIVVRLIMYNVENTQIHIHNVNVEARISERN